MNAIIFPGQGAQYQGMGKELFDAYPQAQKTFSLVDSILGFKISQICFEGSQEDLKRTYYQQLAILVTTLAIYEVFKSKQISVGLLSGLSLGEYTCLYPAGVISLEDLVRLVNVRAQAMEDASIMNPSCMFAVLGISKEILSAQTNAAYYISNLNSPGQVVISMRKENKGEIKVMLESLGGKIIELDVGGGFHSPFMQPAQSRLEEALGKIRFNNAAIPIVSNFTAQPHTDKGEIRDNLVRQLTSPVLWNACVAKMVESRVDLFYEVGPSKVLRGLLRKINPETKVVNIEKKEDLEKLAL